MYAQLQVHHGKEDGSSKQEDEDSDKDPKKDNMANVNNGDSASSNSTTLEELKSQEFEAWQLLREADVNREDSQNGGIMLDSVCSGVVRYGMLGSYNGNILTFLL